MRTVLVPLAVHGGISPRIGAMHFARITYLRKLVERSLEPILVSPLMTSDMVARAYARADGLLCMGGGDIDARLYGHQNHAETVPDAAERDILEVALLRLALADRMPVFGICRGAQALAVAAGGVLHQHIPDRGGAIEHGIGQGNGYDHLETRRKHPVRIRRGSVVHGILGVDEVLMNSGHHQAIASPSRSLIISGWTDDGIAEFVEHRDQSRFCIGVQAHPEADDGRTDALFDAFARAVQNQHIL